MNRKPRILVFSCLPPLPIDRGDKNRLFHMLKLLSAFADVRLACLTRGWESSMDDFELLGEITVNTLTVKKSQVVMAGLRSIISYRPYQACRFDIPAVRGFIKKQIDDFVPDIFWGFQISSSPFPDENVKLRRIIDLVDSPARYAELTMNSDMASWRTRLASRANWRIDKYERRCLTTSDQVIVSSKQDKEHLSSRSGSRGKIAVFPNCVPRKLMEDKWLFEKNRTPRLLFVGNLAYPPNRDAISEIIKDIMPAVRAKTNKAELLICGAGEAELARRYKDLPFVRFTGFIEDLKSEYLQAGLLIAPLSVATGSQYKVLEAMALGLPVVASHAIAESMQTRPGVELLVAQDPEDFAAAAASVFSDSHLAENLATNERNLVAGKYIWENNGIQLEEIVEKVIK